MSVFKDGGYYAFGLCISSVDHHNMRRLRKTNLMPTAKNRFSVSLTAEGKHPVFCTETAAGTRAYASVEPFLVLGIAVNNDGDVGLRVRAVRGGAETEKEKMYYPGKMRGSVLVKSEWVVTQDRD